ncbi:hypothetical protein [Ruminiclostridium josui]|uniref:hypothetical protein n=1 Tax=Ruminiclostridium josui TaxID=1499 RepID=UPI0004642D6D|nr:hypothetical protein [Ruminiclostridium josui]
MLKHEASGSIGKVVEICTESYGHYIGELVKVNSGMCNIAEVKILACSRYPSQRTIMYKFNNYERWPYRKESIETFSIKSLRPYDKDSIPEYYELMPQVLEETFLVETEADREIYERHKKYWYEMRGVISATG